MFPEMLLAREGADAANSGQSSGSLQAMRKQEGQQAGHLSADLDGISPKITKKVFKLKNCHKIINITYPFSC